MATQLRLGQITGSFADRPGGIIDSLAVSDTALTGIPVISGSMIDVMSHMASAIKRVAGGTAAKAFTAVPASTLEDAGGSERITYVDGAATILKGPNGDTEVTVGDADTTFAGLIKQGTITIGSNEIDQSSGDLTLDAAGQIVLDADGGELHIKDATTERARIQVSTQDLVLSASTSDKDIIFMVNDGGTMKAALTLDGADSGRATFNENVVVGGNISGDANEAKTIFAESTSAASTITLGGGGKVIAAGDLDVNGNDLDFAAGNANIGASVGANNLTLGGSTTTVVIAGNLDVNGSTTTIDTVNMQVQDSIIALGVSGSGAYSASGDRGILFPRGGPGSKAAGFFFDGTDFNLGMSITGPASGSFASVASAEYSSLKMGTLKAGADSQYDLGEDGTAYRKLYVDDIDLNGVGRIDFDADADTSIRAGTQDDVLIFEVGGNDEMVLTTAGLLPSSSDGYQLGSATRMWSDLFLADEAVINFNAGDVTMTHSSNLLAIAGGNTRVDRLELDGATNYLDVDTNLQVVAAADILLDAGGNDIALQGDATNPFSQFNRASSNTAYINFSTNDGAAITAGTGGFGFRNNNGAMQVKNSGGDWANIASVTSGGGKFTAKQTALQVPGTALSVGSFDRSGVAEAERSDKIDVFVNGQLLLSGGNIGTADAEDYFLSADDKVKFSFALEPDDLVTVIVRG